MNHLLSDPVVINATLNVSSTTPMNVDTNAVDVRSTSDASVAGQYNTRGIAGYTVIQGANYNAGSTSTGLTFGPYALGVAGSANLKVTGINTGVFMNNGSTLTAGDIYGGEIFCGQDLLGSSGTINASSATVLRLYNANDGLSTTDHYGLYIEEPTRGSNNHTIYTTGGQHTFGGALSVAGDITLSGTVDGRDILADGIAQDSHISAISAHGVAGSLVGTTDAQTLTNKTFNADNNTLSNITNAHIKSGAGININKLANGVVTNTEFQYLSGVTSGIQAQINAKAASSHNHSASSITSGTFANGRIAASNVTQHNTALDHGLILGLGDDDHTQYALLAGRSGGQTFIGGTAANDDLILTSTSNVTKGDIIVNNRLVTKSKAVINDQGYTSPYTCSIQKNAEDCWLEILNNGGANKGAFFGVNNNDFELYNWQGGPINFYTHTTASNGLLRMVIQNDGGVQIKNLGLGVVKSSAAGILSHEATKSGFNLALGTTAGTVAEGNHAHGALEIGNGDVSNTELSYLNNATSNIQAQLDGKISTGAANASDITAGTLLDARVAESNVTQYVGAVNHDALLNYVANEHIDWTVDAGINKVYEGNLPTNINVAKLANGTVSSVEFQRLSGVTSSVQSQLNSKASLSHNHSAADLTSGNMPNARIPASNVTQHVGAIDHDSLLNYSAVQHYDWSNNTGVTVHNSNISSSSVTQHISLINHDLLLNYNADRHINWKANSGEVVHDSAISASSVIQHATSIDHNSLSNTGVLTHTQLDSHVNSTSAHGVNGDLVGTNDTQTLTNKILDCDSNTVTNIDNGDIKAGASIDATKIHDGSVSNNEFKYLSGVTSNIQTQLNTLVTDFFYGCETDGTTLNASLGVWTDVPINMECKKTAGFTHVADSAEITVVNAGIYRIDTRLTVIDNGANDDGYSESRVLRDTGSGYTEIMGSRAAMYHASTNVAHCTSNSNMIIDLTAGDKIKIQASQITGVPTVDLVAYQSCIVIDRRA